VSPPAVATLATLEAMVPSRYRVVDRRDEAPGTVTLAVEPVDDPLAVPAPGQFVMAYVLGVGEVPISVSACSAGRMELTVRRAGATTAALCGLGPGVAVGVRGPFGRGWTTDDDDGDGSARDVIVVGGGLGLAPLRPLVHHVLARRERFGRVRVLVGSRRPADLLFRPELEQWRARLDVDVEVTVDQPGAGWRGNVGVVADLLNRVPVDPATTWAHLCGPEPMLRFTARALEASGVDAARIEVSLERNMHCGIRQCGHCQLGPLFVCAEGPVVPWSVAAPLLEVRKR